ncbi:MAG: DEAD/DEAH box helicase [Bdellovibrionota bacterium]
MPVFSDFELLHSLQRTLADQRLTQPTEIQNRAIPLLLNGSSVVGVAETGGGKTLSYVLPVLHRLKTLEDQGESIKAEAFPRAVVIVPTRELGEQVSKVFKIFTHDTRLRVRTVLGGTTMEIARRNIKGPFEVLVATPGRLVQLMDRKLVHLNDVRTLVFDEADQMLDQGFLNDANQIVAECPVERQMALFSATVSKPIQELIRTLFSNAEVIRSHGSHKIVSTLKTENKFIKDGKRLPVLEKVLNKSTEGGTLIFTNTREQCDKVAEELDALGHTHVIYRGEMDKVERRANLKLFRDSKVGILISTDLASRGLDVEHVGLVINYHLPKQIENYIHRVGRTARAGREGLVINFVTERDKPLMKQIEEISKSKN